MAAAAGQTFPDFTPPEGETHNQVTSGCPARIPTLSKLFFFLNIEMNIKIKLLSFRFSIS